jgi:hypothetical protein
VYHGEFAEGVGLLDEGVVGCVMRLASAMSLIYSDPFPTLSATHWRACDGSSIRLLARLSIAWVLFGDVANGPEVKKPVSSTWFLSKLPNATGLQAMLKTVVIP